MLYSFRFKFVIGDALENDADDLFNAAVELVLGN